MGTLVLVLRLVHIVGGVFWAGTAFFLAGFLGPSVAATAPDGSKVMGHLLARTRFNTAIGLAATLTAVSGVILFVIVSGNLQMAWITTAAGLALSIGAVAGLLGFFHGMTAILPTSLRTASLVREIAASGGPPSPEQSAQLGALAAKSSRNSRIVAYLLVIAVLGMAASEAL